MATSDDESRQFLFIHQTSDQQRLMNMLKVIFPYMYFCILDGVRSIELSRCSPHNQANNPQTTPVVHRYGNEICLLDATYKKSRNALPLFFVAVPTNTCYQVIASFIKSSGTTDSISQALKVLSRWKTDRKPANWIPGCCQAEISVVGNVLSVEINNYIHIICEATVTRGNDVSNQSTNVKNTVRFFT